ncbi:Ribonuclease P [Operophtera brumata]|uniref:Ribonuclease P n=1 Tax=Operophtera brumata TaxID=104452 RepID=A0A0L7LEM4_OPEBR|nr:Ribonuclease P [Operophtera brumata]
MSCHNWGFCDLCVSNKIDLEKIESIEKLGYNTIALNTYVEEPLGGEPKPKKKKGETREKKDYIPDPVDIPKEIAQSCKLNILQRVTIEFSESGIAHKLNQSENLKKYDIIAVVPKTLSAFQYACGSMDIDMISLETNCRIPFKVNRKLYRQAIERGIFFELTYSPAIRDSTARKNIITTAHNYYAVGKSKNIVITSGAESYMHLRGVHDVISIGFLFGLNSNESMESIRSNARTLILKAEGRRHGKHHMVIQTVDVNKDQTFKD